MNHWQEQSKEVSKKLKKIIVESLETQHGLNIEIIKGVLKQCFNVDSNSPGKMADELSRINPIEFKKATNRYLQRQKSEEIYGVI